jgi:hypothetical protein
VTARDLDGAVLAALAGKRPASFAQFREKLFEAFDQRREK